MMKLLCAAAVAAALLYFVYQSYREESLPPSVERRYQRWQDGERPATVSSDEVEELLFGDGGAS